MNIRRPPARVLLADGLLAAALAAFCILFVTYAPLWHIPPHPHAALDVRAYLLTGAAIGALLARSAAPLATLTVTVLASAAYLAGSYVYNPAILAAMGVAVYSFTWRRPIRRSAGIAVVTLVVIVGGHVVGFPGNGGGFIGLLPGWLAYASMWLLTPWAIGVVVGLRRETLARRREEEFRRHADDERLRIAREVHDVVGHGLAAINMQAGVALHVLDRRPEQARPALEAIKKSSKDALDELRGTLAVFRQPGGPEDAEAPTRPTPGLGQLDTLISNTNESGLPVTVEVTDSHNGLATAHGDGSLPALPTLPAAVDVAAYRIVQESLTNVLRHAGPASATVRIQRDPRDVVIEVVDDGQAHPSSTMSPGGTPDGHGIAGMRERATAVGGALEAGPRPEGGYRVRALLPAGDGDPDGSGR